MKKPSYILVAFILAALPAFASETHGGGGAEPDTDMEWEITEGKIQARIRREVGHDPIEKDIETMKLIQEEMGNRGKGIRGVSSLIDKALRLQDLAMRVETLEELKNIRKKVARLKIQVEAAEKFSRNSPRKGKKQN